MLSAKGTFNGSSVPKNTITFINLLNLKFEPETLDLFTSMLQTDHFHLIEPLPQKNQVKTHYIVWFRNAHNVQFNNKKSNNSLK